MLVDHSNKSFPNELTQISPQNKPPLLKEKIPAPELTQIYLQNKLPLLEEKSPSPQHFSKLVNKNTILKMNMASYFLDLLASPDESTWSTTGGPINKTI